MVTYVFVPDMTGIDLKDEDEKFLKYLAENGWEGEVGDDADGLVDESDTSSDDVVVEKQV